MPRRSAASSIGAQIAIDLVNEKGGIGGKYKVSPIAADSQSKPDVAINEANRLIDQEKIDIINGVDASSHAVPLAAKVEQQKKILWITTAVSTAVFKDKNLQYVFRAQIYSDQYGQAFAGFLNEHAKAKLGLEPKDVKVALIHEDGPYGSALPPPTRPTPRRQDCRSCSRKVIRRLRPTFRYWSQSSSAPGRT